MEQSQIPPQLSSNSPGTPNNRDDTTTGDGPTEANQLDVSACDTSRESDLSTTSPEREFSIRETNFDRGQLKLRIASKRVNKKTNVPGSSGGNKECVSSPSSGDESTEDFKSTKTTDIIAQDNLDNSDIKEPTSTSKKVRAL